MEEERYVELVSKSIGEIREMLAYEDADETLEKFLADNGWIEEEDYTDDEVSGDWDEDEEDTDDWDEDEEDEDYDDAVPGEYNLDNPQEEALAEQIANDIDAGRYRIEDIMGVYSLEFVDRVNYLIG